MDYEEKYKAALERAKQFSENPLLEDSAGIVEYIFPELAESEDERIRQEIIEHIKWSYDDQDCAEAEMIRWIAWLEKQGEDSPVLSNSSNVGNPEGLEAAATNYAQDKYLPVQTAQAFMAGARWVLTSLTPSSPAGQAPT